MHFVLKTSQQALVSLSTEELQAITHALQEVCLGDPIPVDDFQARLGVTRESLAGLRSELLAEPHDSRQTDEVVHVWVDQGVVMVRVMSVFGDPVEMTESEAAELSSQLQQAVAEAS